MKYLLCIVFLAACQTTSTPDPAPSAEGGIIDNVGKKLDKVDSRVGAAIVVAKENVTNKPLVAIKELDVASSYLPKPTEGDVAFARQRASQNNEKVYLDAIAYGKKSLADLDANWVKMEDSQKKSKVEIDALKADIKKLQDDLKAKDVEIQKAKEDIVTWACVVLGGITAIAAIGFAWMRQFLVAGVSGTVSVFALAYPSLIGTPWFLPSLGVLILASLVAGFAFLRRSNTQTIP
jgi:hypothetical protein